MINSSHHKNNKNLAYRGRNPIALKGDLVRLEKFFPNVPSRSQGLAVGIPGAVLGLANELVHGFPTDLYGVAIDINIHGSIWDFEALSPVKLP